MEVINDRIRALREGLGLSQTAFGEPIGLSRDEVKNIEYKKTSPKEITIPLSCNTYGVRESWLRDGTGPMHTTMDEADELDRIFAEIGASDDELVKAAIRVYWRLDEKEKAAIGKPTSDLVAKLDKKKSPGE